MKFQWKGSQDCLLFHLSAETEKVPSIWGCRAQPISLSSISDE